jgi:hypothetical protein
MKYNLNNKKPLILAITAISGLAALSASANVIVHNASTTVVEGDTLGVNQLIIPEYSGDVADLVSVQIIVTLSVPSFTLDVDNDAVDAASGNVQFFTIGSPNFDLAGANSFDGTDTLGDGYFSVATQNDAFTVTGNDTDNTATFDLDAGPDNHSFNTTVVNVGQVTARFVDASQFASWVGGGNVTFDIAADLGTDLNFTGGGGGGDVRFQGVIPSATFSVQVIYTDTIPEPSSALLGGLGLLFLLRRKR